MRTESALAALGVTGFLALTSGCATTTPDRQDDPFPDYVVQAYRPAAAPVPATRPPVEPKPRSAPEIQQVSHQVPEPAAAKPNPGSPTPAPAAQPPASGSPLTLDQIVNATLLADPKLRAGFEAINQANGDALTASLKPNPELFMDAQLLPLTRPFTVTRQGGPPQQDVNLSYPIDWFLFGKRAAIMQAAALGVRVSEADYADRVRQRVLDAATAYYDILEAKAILDLARQDVENLQRVEAVTQKAVEGGGRPQVDLNRIRLDRLRSEQTLREAETARVGATARLRAVLGRSDADPAFDVDGTIDNRQLFEPLPVDEAFAVAQQNRPDVQSLRWRIAQASASVEVERRKAYPAVTPQAGYTRQYQTKAVGFPDANSYSLAVTATLPFHDRNQGNRAKAASVAVQTQFDYQAGLAALRAEVVQADQELRAAAANARAVAGEQLKLAEQVRDAISQAYTAGGRPLIDVLDAQRNYRETYRLFITSHVGYGRAVVRYHAALGKQATP